MAATPKYRRILLKLSGEALAGDKGFGIVPEVLEQICKEVHEVHELGVEIALVIGGGNFFRGLPASEKGMDRAHADYMGMLATMINALALQDVLERRGAVTRVQSAIGMMQLAEPYIRRRALRHLEKRRILIFAGGTGNPFFSTDTAASLRALEIRAEAILKATKVDGVYDSDPKKNKNARKYTNLKFEEAIARDLKVMDSTALAMCKDNNLPIVVFNLGEAGNIKRVVTGEKVGTLVTV